MTSLGDDERERYGRQLALPALGERGQELLRRGAVLVVGAGGLGSAVLPYLVGAGVGRIGLVDDDVVRLSDLQRQTLYGTEDLGRAKALRAAARLASVNPEVKVEARVDRLTAANAEDVVKGYDVVVSAVDNVSARHVLNAVCVRHGLTLVEGAVSGLLGSAITIAGGVTACYRCLFPDDVDQEAAGMPAAVLGPVPGVIGSVQALEVIKVLAGVGKPLYDRMLQFDGERLAFSEVAVRRSPDCPACGDPGRRSAGW